MVYITADIGINHNGSLGTAMKLITAAKGAGCDAVKFQKRDPDISVPLAQRTKIRETPWGQLTYIEYKRRMEFGQSEYDAIARECSDLKIDFFASAWDIPSGKFLEQYNMPYLKIPSAVATDEPFLHWVAKSQAFDKVMLSTGMCTQDDVDSAIKILGKPIVMHCTSTYPCPHDEINLRYMLELRRLYPDLQIGYSGHETGLATTVAAVALGAQYIERHITLNRASWGSDHAASIEPSGFVRLVKDARAVEASLGDGFKKVEPGEYQKIQSLKGSDYARKIVWNS